MRCIDCGSTDLPLGRPRKDGSRWPASYCRACLAKPSRVGGGIEAKRRAARAYQRRQRSGFRVLLGPCPCMGCGEPLVYVPGRWISTDTGRAHHCGVIGAAAA